MSSPPTLAHTRSGEGEPLVLLHALGLSSRTWEPVIPLLAERFDVIAIDLPGFGESEPLPPEVEPHPAELAAAVAATLTKLGIVDVHLAGNSLGGWVCLEMAAMLPVRSLTLLAPAGLWRRHTPAYCRVSLRATRFIARYVGWLARPLLATRTARTLMFAQSVGRPTRMTPAQARDAVTAMGSSPGFRATLRATLRRRYLAQKPIEAPVTLVFGTRDRILLPRQSRHLDQLPPHTRQAALAGAGHVPMTDDPEGIAALIGDTASLARRAGKGGAV